MASSSKASSSSSSVDTVDESKVHKYSDVYDVKMPTEKHIYELLEKAFKKCPKKELLVDGHTDEVRTAEQLETQITQLTNTLNKRGLKKGDIVTICMESNLQYLVILMAVLRNGATYHGHLPMLNTKESKEELEDVGPRIVFYSEQTATVVKEAFKNLSSVEMSFQIPQQFQELLDEGSAIQDAPPRIGGDLDPALLVYTSGTTGKPKGVLLSHRSLICSIAGTASAYSFPDDSVFLLWSTLAFCDELLVMLMSLCHCHKTILMHSKQLDFDLVKNVVGPVMKYKVTALPCVVTVVVRILGNPNFKTFDLSSIRILLVGGSLIPPKLMEGIKAALPHAFVIQAYGQTEVGTITHATPLNSSKIASCGKLLPFFESKVVAESGNLAAPGEPGVIKIRGPQVMLGYHRSPEATAKKIDTEGWLDSGDVGYYDKEGFYYIVERNDDIIKCMAVKVAPWELEAVLRTHPGVLDVTVVGKKDQEYGEVPVAFVVRNPEFSQLSEEELTEYINKQVSEMNQLRGGVIFIDIVPRSRRGKPKRAELRKKYLNA
ncbi:unnamed protein product [Cyprideis torosa]|uniref:Uncharacterized protein n=1 Tax=Cyprideis torosa TaxID=163714 RepID=A0A7R8ZRX3_9CRUS|nr:unnamed protein product [Cyprideis torosa]CAG0894203.1 unnamed protein product [Cyprideis torosa]